MAVVRDVWGRMHEFAAGHLIPVVAGTKPPEEVLAAEVPGGMRGIPRGGDLLAPRNTPNKRPR